jgi:16S rRNA (guanine527-N7)-methyltransferase
MSEDEAKVWLQTQFNVSRETMARLEGYVTLLLDEGERQNLIADSTRKHVWARHIVDSAQLLLHAPPVHADAQWIDLGSGAGLPGMIIAILSGYQEIGRAHV